MSVRNMAAAALLLAALAAQGCAQEKKSFRDMRHIAPTPTSSENGVVGGLRLAELNIDGKTTNRVPDRGAVRLGKRVKVCFDVSRRGYVSLWSQSADGVLERIIPNHHMVEAQADAVAVRPGEYCVAENGLVDAAGEQAAENKEGGWGFRVQKPYGEAELFLYWTGKMEHQPGKEVVVDIDALDTEIGKKISKSRCIRCTSKTTYSYRVVPGGGGQ